PVAAARSGERRSELLEGVPVARRRLPAEGAEALLEVSDRDDLSGGLVRLELVPVDDDREPGKTFVRGGLQPLVVLALLELAVADHPDDAASAPEPPLRPCDPAALRDPHA